MKNFETYSDALVVPATLANGTTIYSQPILIKSTNNEVMLQINGTDASKVTDTIGVGVETGTKKVQPAKFEGSAVMSGAVGATDVFTIKLTGSGWASGNTGRSELTDADAVTITATTAINTAATDEATVVRLYNAVLNSTTYISSGSEFAGQPIGNWVEFYLENGKVNFRTKQSGAEYGVVLTDSTGTPLADMKLTAGTQYGSDYIWTQVDIDTTTIANGGALAAMSGLLQVDTGDAAIGEYVRYFIKTTDGTGAIIADHGITIDATVVSNSHENNPAKRSKTVYSDVALNALTFAAGGSEFIYTDGIDTKGKISSVKATAKFTDISKITAATYVKIETSPGIESTTTFNNSDSTAYGTSSDHTTTYWTPVGATWYDASAGTACASGGAGVAANYSTTVTEQLDRFVRVVVYDQDGSGALIADSGITINLELE